MISIIKLNKKLLIIAFVIGFIIGLPSYYEIFSGIGDQESLGLFLFSFLVSQTLYTVGVAIVLVLGLWLFKKLGLIQPKK